MKSNYKKIGDFIHLIDDRNAGLKIKTLLGLSISKQFIPSVANIIGTDMENYKIIRKNQFACSTMQVRRDKKMPVALLQKLDEAIISQAYPVFAINDTNKLLPEYLMMWFSREEFDREACFYAIGGVRGSLEWDDFCDMTMQIPTHEKQKEIIKEYKVLLNHIALNNLLIQKLEETVQAIYKQWFLDFEFPDENGKPYRSYGGEMEFIGELEKEIPKGWTYGCLGDITEKITDGTHSTVIDDPLGKYHLLSCKNIKNGQILITESDRKINLETLTFLRKRTDLSIHDILVTTVGTIGEVAQITTINIPYELQRSVAILKANNLLISHQYLYQFTKSKQFQNQAEFFSEGTAQKCLFLGSINQIKILIPNKLIQNKFDKYSYSINKMIGIYQNKLIATQKACDILLAKMSLMDH